MFLDYDGTLTPIVDRPEDAVISASIRNAVRGLAGRCTVCLVSGRDRPVVQTLMDVDDLVVAGRHASGPPGRCDRAPGGGGSEELLDRVTARLRDKRDSIEGTLVEPKKECVAAHYRLVSEEERRAVEAVVERLLADHPEELKVTPGKMVYELQPEARLGQGQGRALPLGGARPRADDVVPSTSGTTSPMNTPARALDTLAC